MSASRRFIMNNGLTPRLITATVSRAPGRLALALLSSALLVLSFPGPDLGWLAWVALVPLVIACADAGPGASFTLGLASGMAASFGIFSWMFAVPGFRWFHAALAALYLGSYCALWCSGISLGKRAGIPLAASAPVLWVSLDFLKSHAGFLALPWASLAHSQHGNLVVLQMSSLTGEAGVTFLVVLVNAAIAAFILKQGYIQLIAVGAVLATVVAYGAWNLSAEEKSGGLRVAVVQPCIWPGEQEKDPGQSNTLKKLDRLTAAAAASSPSLVAWPETAVLNLQSSPSIRQRLDNLSRKSGAAIMVGASERVKFTDHALDGSSGKGIRSYNAAYLIRSGSPDMEPYRKNRLVPFGEYLPLEGIVRWPSWFVGKGFNTVPGKDRTLFRLPGRVGCGVLICWENLFAGIAREEVRLGAGMLVNLVNDGWFGTSSASRQHNSASVLRAVENGVPVVVASNCGPSQVIDASGRVIASLPDGFLPGSISADVQAGRQLTFYTRHGDLFSFLCVAAGLTGILWVCVRRFIKG